MEKYAIIVAGGAGTRMGSNLPKQFLSILNRPVLWHTITAFYEAFNDIRIILVLPEDHLELGQSILQSMPEQERIAITIGGKSRFESVKNGLCHVPRQAVVFVHDGVRCLVTASLIQRCYETALEKGNAIPAVGAIDTLRIETSTGNELLDRSKVKVVQTPQTFMSDIIKDAFEREYNEAFTDDASVLESCGYKIHLVEGETTNLKITTRLDLIIAEQILKNRIKGKTDRPGSSHI